MSETGGRGLEGLQIWNKALALAVRVCKEVLPRLPAEEKWALASQLRRAVQSIPANIAEGHGRFYYQDHVRFCYIARGSLEETLSHLTLASQLDYLTDGELESLRADITELRKMVDGYISYLKTSKHGANEPGADLALHDDLTRYLLEDPDN